KSLTNAHFHYYKLKLTDAQGEQIYEKSIRMNESPETPLASLLTNENVSKTKLKAAEIEQHIKNKFMARVGRKPTICENATMEGSQGKKHHLWNNHLLPCTKANVEKIDKDKYLAHVIFDTGSTQFIDGTIELTYSNNNAVHIRYDLIAHGEGESVETGLAFKTGEKAGNIRWIGKGPYACYPGKDALSEFGFWKLNSGDIYFPGNREEVECLLFTNILAKGFAIIPETSKNVALERYPDGIVISHNSHVATPFNKNIWPEKTVQLDGYKIEGAFTIVPQTADWNPTLRSFFGEPTKNIKPFNPFYHSYDQ
ncbi:MAG: hypothetical protein IIT94_01910, partial [Prevotella sp.]|nr:hypothetical protein [Prevotella sp.]